MQQSYDVAIVGGGPAGLTLALALVRHMRGIRVAILDRRDFALPPDQRATAIAAAVRRVFEQLGVWPGMAADACPVRQMKITDSGQDDISRPLFLSFAGEVAPGEPFAHLVPNRTMAAALLAELQGEVEFLAPVEITGFAVDDGAATLTLRDGRTISAPLVVAGDGVNSALRTMAGIEVTGHDYDQVGIVTTIAHALDHEGTAFEHFRPAGPFASLPLNDDAEGRHRSSLVWTERPDTARTLRDRPLDEVGEIIEQVMGASLGTITVLERLQSFPLRLQLAKSFVAPRLALIGDAAHVVHPIAGQGLNLGLADVAALAEVVVETLRLGLDHGAPDVLVRYQRWRRFDTTVMAAVTDGMNRLFSNDVAAVRAMRDFGLGLVDRAAPLKNAMIERAAGLAGGAPRLLSGYPI